MTLTKQCPLRYLEPLWAAWSKSMDTSSNLFPAFGTIVSIINTQKNRLSLQVIWDKAQGYPGSNMEETGAVHFGIGTGIVESVEGFFRQAG